MIYLAKILPEFVLPIGLSILLLAWGILRNRRAFQFGGLAVLLMFSNPAVGRALIRRAEQGAIRIPAAEAGDADAIVVLSAGRVLAPGPARVTEWGDANRFFGGAELFAAHKAPVIVFTSPSMPWDRDASAETVLYRRTAESLGVPADKILVTGSVENTADEAREAARLLGVSSGTHRTILLVTSAYHMPRASRLFGLAGFAVKPFPVDFIASESGGMFAANVIPSVGALKQSEIALHEFYGRAYYRLRALFGR
jgi:uncharacterized SAM-binding protein YcdF (DUF218 family)